MSVYEMPLQKWLTESTDAWAAIIEKHYTNLILDLNIWIGNTPYGCKLKSQDNTIHSMDISTDY